jgi:cytochrome c
MKSLVFTLACALSFSTLYAAPPVSQSSMSTPVYQADSVDLNQYVGKYKFEGLPFEFVTIGVKDGQLTIDTGSESGAMTPVKNTPDAFDAAGRATLTFKRDDTKKVTGVTLDAQGMSFEGKKEN